MVRGPGEGRGAISFPEYMMGASVGPHIEPEMYFQQLGAKRSGWSSLWAAGHGGQRLVLPSQVCWDKEWESILWGSNVCPLGALERTGSEPLKKIFFEII